MSIDLAPSPRYIVSALHRRGQYLGLPSLQHAIAAQLPGFHGSIAGAGALAAADPGHVLPALASAFGTTFRVALVLTAAALVPALALPGRPGKAGHAPEPCRAPEPRHAPSLATLPSLIRPGGR